MIDDLNLLVTNYSKIKNNEQKILQLPKCIVHYPIKVISCCGQGKAIKQFYLNDLVNAWNNGFTYQNYPIIQSVGHSGNFYIKYIKDGIIEKADNVCNSYQFKNIDSNITSITLSELLSSL